MAVDKFGSETIDILVNNAGVAFNKKLIDASENEWDQTINPNLKGSYLFTKAGFSNLSSYCASKFGLFGLTESLALEVVAYNLRVMTIFLGHVATQMWQQFDRSYFEENKKRMLDPHNVREK